MKTHSTSLHSAKILFALFLMLTLCLSACSKKTIEVKSITLSKTTLTLDEGANETLTATIAPSNAEDKRLTWNSSDATIATVDAGGRVVAVKEGSANITATATNGVKGTCALTVKKPVFAVTGVSLDKTTLALEIGDIETLTATVSPDNATNKAVSWASDNTDVATVSTTGEVTALAAGTATLTVTTTDGNKTANCVVTVSARLIAVTGISLNKTTLKLDVGEKETLIVTFNPENASNKKLYWSSSNTVTATVDDSGEISAHTGGTATITVTTDEGGLSISCELLVVSTNGKVSINNGAEISFATGQLAEKLSGSVSKLVFGEKAELNGTDIKAIMSLSATLEHLDLSQATIVKGGEAYDSGRTTELYYIGEYMFYDMPKLKTALLPLNTLLIDNSAFANCPLSHYTLPEGIVSIYRNAFANANMASVTLPASLNYIGYEYHTLGYLNNIQVAAGNSQYKSVDGVVYSLDGETLLMYPRNRSTYEVPEGTKKLEKSCFINAKISSLKLPSSLQTIENAAIQETSLTTLTIPANVTEIYGGAIAGNEQLQTITVLANQPPVRPGSGDILYSNGKLATIYAPFASVAAYKAASAWSPYANIIKPIPETIPPGKVSINNGAEQDYIVGSLAAKLGGSVNKIVFGSEAPLNGTDIKAMMALSASLEYLDMTTATIVEGGESYYSDSFQDYYTMDYVLGGSMFHTMPKLKSVWLPKNTRMVQRAAFWECPELSFYNLPEGLTYIEYYAFGQSQMASVTLPKSLSYISYQYHTLGYLDNIYVANSHPLWKSIDGVVYSLDGKTLLMFPRNRSHYDVPEGVETLGRDCFDLASFTSIKLPSTLSTLEYYAFRHTTISSITLPAGVKEIYQDAIFNNLNLISVVMEATAPPKAYENSFTANYSLTSIYVPNASVGAYKAAEGWKAYASMIKPISEKP